MAKDNILTWITNIKIESLTKEKLSKTCMKKPPHTRLVRPDCKTQRRQKKYEEQNNAIVARDAAHTRFSSFPWKAKKA
jgi:hypothetical protein